MKSLQYNKKGKKDQYGSLPELAGAGVDEALALPPDGGHLAGVAAGRGHAAVRAVLGTV